MVSNLTLIKSVRLPVQELEIQVKRNQRDEINLSHTVIKSVSQMTDFLQQINDMKKRGKKGIGGRGKKKINETKKHLGYYSKYCRLDYFKQQKVISQFFFFFFFN